MRPLQRNQQTFYYAELVDVEPLEDASGGNGQFGVMYGAPVKSKGNIAPATGEKTTRQFGETLDYDKVLIPEAGCEINEHCILWVDCDAIPQQNADGSFSPPWTHEVKRVARSLNGTSVALQRVNVR